jgi:hypothetical protein
MRSNSQGSFAGLAYVNLKAGNEQTRDLREAGFPLTPLLVALDWCRYPARGWLGAAMAVMAAAVVLCGSGCSVVQHETQATKSMIGSLTGRTDGSGETNRLEQVQSGVMREADLYAGTIAQATDDFRAKVPTAEARLMAQQWKVMEATAAYINATGEYPSVNAVDMLVLATLSRFVMEDYWVGEKFGEAARPLLETHRDLESNAWTIVQIVLTPDQQEEIRTLLGEYRQRYPHLRYVAAVRMQQLAGVLGELPTEAEQSKRPGSLFSLLYLNPLAGLDPTTEAIQQTRLLAQRAMYYAQRAPTLLSWQAELTLYQLAAQPESKLVLSNLNEIGQSTKTFATTAAGLTNLVNAQREAAINQIFDRLAIERTNLLAELAGEETKLRGLLNETRQTLGTGSEMAKSVNAAIQSLDSFVRYVSPPDTNPPAVNPDTNSRPFNVLDYGTAAGEIGAMATNLTTMILAVNQSEAQVSRLGSQAATEAKAVVNHAFRLAIALTLLAGVVLAVVLWMHRRSSRNAPASKPNPAGIGQ